MSVPMDISEPLDNIFMLGTANHVFFMSVGFCLLEMGVAQPKNHQLVLAKYLLVPAIVFLCWYVMGYAIAYGPNMQDLKDGVAPGKFGSGAFFAMGSFFDMKPLFRDWFFQGCFCNLAAFVVTAGVSERMTLLSFVILIALLASAIYPLIVWWAWSNYGWLKYKTLPSLTPVSMVGPYYQDTAGSGVVHYAAGLAALIATVLLGPRKGRFEGSSQNFGVHNVPFTVLGTFLLWFAWFGYNTGGRESTPTLSVMNSSNLAFRTALITVNTALAPCTAGLIVFFFRSFVLAPRKLDVVAMTKGVLAGLVAITAPCSYVKPFEAIIIGGLAGFAYLLSAWLFSQKLKIDDPLEVIPVHFVNGILGVIAAGFFGNPNEGIGGNGFFYGGSQLGTQFVALFFIGLWVSATTLTTLLPFYFLRRLTLVEAEAPAKDVEPALA